jgi:hypothetical protein
MRPTSSPSARHVMTDPSRLPRLRSVGRGAKSSGGPLRRTRVPTTHRIFFGRPKIEVFSPRNESTGRMARLQH